MFIHMSHVVGTGAVVWIHLHRVYYSNMGHFFCTDCHERSESDQ